MKFSHILLLALLCTPLVLQPAFADRGGGGGRGGGGWSGGGARGGSHGNHGASRNFDGGSRGQVQRNFEGRRNEGFSQRAERGSSGSAPRDESRRSEWRERTDNNGGQRDSQRGNVGHANAQPMPGGMATGSFPPQRGQGWNGRIDAPRMPGPTANVRHGNWRGDRNGSDNNNHWNGSRGNHQNWNKDRNGQHNWNGHNNNHNNHNNHGGHHGPSKWHSRWHGHNGWHDIRHFKGNHHHHWKHGHWHHGYHGSHWGWWWVVGPSFYFYNGPVYPYPDPYIPPAVVIESVPIMQNEDAAPDYYYFCENPQGYYPYVPECSTAWIPVPAEQAEPPVAENPN